MSENYVHSISMTVAIARPIVARRHVALCSLSILSYLSGVTFVIITFIKNILNPLLVRLVATEGKSKGSELYWTVVTLCSQ